MHGNLHLEELQDELATCGEVEAHGDADLNDEHLPLTD